MDTTHWILQIADGNREAAEELWQRYYHRLVGFAKRQLGQMPTSARDEEDLALSAFDSFYRAAEAGRFPQLRDSDAFWSLLITIAARKVANHIRAEKRQRRDIGRLVPNGALALELQVADPPTPAIVTQAIDTFREILGKLDDGNLQTIAIKKMEGYSNQEIATELRCSVSTVERKVKLIRRHFSEEL